MRSEVWSQTRTGVITPQSPPPPAALAARWRDDTQVFRRYGAAGRARLLERMAAELEVSTHAHASATVDLSTAAALSGFSRAHLRRLIREGKLGTTADGALLRVKKSERRGRGGQAPCSPADP
jgi:hypothetical protein